MRSKLEEYSRIYDVLCALKTGYTKGDFSSLFPYLAPDCVMESQWVMQPNTGYDEVTAYFRGKGETLSKSGSFPKCDMVKLIYANTRGINAIIHEKDREAYSAFVKLAYEEGKPCLLMKQYLNHQFIEVMVEVKLNKQGMVQRIDLCMPELFHYEYFEILIGLYPSNGENVPKMPVVQISTQHFDELEFFLGCVNIIFSEYEDVSVPMEKWCSVLDYWKQFMAAESYDSMFESLGEVDYENNHIGKPQITGRLGKSGAQLWERRNKNRKLLHDLIEWTDQYRNDYAFINISGTRSTDDDEDDDEYM